MPDCPNCHQPLPVEPVLVQALTVCPNLECLRTLATDDAGASFRLAVSDDTFPLNMEQATALKDQRVAARKARKVT